MSIRHVTKFIHEGPYVAAAEIDWIYSDTEWSPGLSLDDARKLDDAREALRRGDLRKAADLSRVYELTPVAV